MRSSQDVAVSAEQLEAILQVEKFKCERLPEKINIKNATAFCKTIWDGIMCWTSAYPGQVLTQHCPQYIAGFDSFSNATKECTANGTWFVSPLTQQEWTNYSHCFTNQETTIFVEVSAVNSLLIKEYLPLLKLISHLGYGISLLTLIVASIVLSTFRIKATENFCKVKGTDDTNYLRNLKSVAVELFLERKLYCPRNTLHLHLFISFIMRAFVTFLKEFLFEQGIGLRSDFVVRNGTKLFVDEINDNWECKGLTTVWQYFILANYSWILMEGLYIHNLLMFALFSDTSSIFFYVILGWGLPLIFVGSWAVVRIKLENDLCWTTNSISRNFLIIRVPIVISVLVNFGLFLNIVRLLLVKVRSSVQEETQRYWKWAKSTLVLAPLFGVHYAVFLGMSYSVGVNEIVELVWLFCDQLFASFQGFFVAVLYCFLNSEVQTEVKKKMRRLIYQVRITDRNNQQRSNFTSWPSSYSINHSRSIFTFCHPFSFKYRTESKESKRTETEDFLFQSDHHKASVDEKCRFSKNAQIDAELKGEFELQNL